MRQFSLSIALACVLSVSCITQEHEDYNRVIETPIITNSISNQKVSSFAEDVHGHIWIATFRGLNRFNVHEYHQHFCTSDEFSLPDNQVQCLYKDSKGRLWVSTVNGMALYTEQDNFQRIPMETNSRNASQILEDMEGRIFINTMVELAMYDEEQKKFVTVLSSVDGSMPPLSQGFVSRKHNELLLANAAQLTVFDPVTFEVKDVIPLENFPSVFNLLSDDILWMCSYGKVALYDVGERRFIEIPEGMKSHPLFNRTQVTYVFPYGDTILFNTEKDGMFIYDPVEEVLYHQSEKGFPFEVPDVKINTMFLDSSDNLWIGTYDQGYHVIYAYEEIFNNDSWLKSNLGHKSVVSIECDSRDNLWITTLKDGLYFYNAETAVFRRFESDAKEVFVDSKDRLWLTDGVSVSRCRTDGTGLKVEKSWPVFWPMSMSEDADGRIWVGAMGENVYYISDDDELKTMKALSAHFTFTPYCLPLADGTVLSASFEQGLSQLDGRSNHSRQISVPEAQWKDGIRRSVFVPVCLHQSKDGTVWIGTLANGLFRYDVDENSLQHIPGAPCLDITSIEEDAAGNLWVSTQYGLGKYDIKSDKFTNWFADDGIGGNQFYDRSSCRLSDGTLIFGGTHGLTVFDPEYVVVDREIPLYFEDLKIHNVLVRPGDDECIDKSLTYRPRIGLKYNQNSFSISFAALEYSKYERVEYQYMLDGFDDYWIDAHNNREAYYSNIPSGRYDFRIRILTQDHSVILAENQIQVSIDSPWWLSWWMFLIYACILMGVIYTILRVRNRIMSEKTAKLKAQQEKEQEKKLNKMNMDFFANISHEFRTPLTMISGPVAQLVDSSDITKENKRLLDIVQRNIRRMLRLVNQHLDFNKLENDTLKLAVKPIDVIEQLINLTDIFRVSAEEKGIIFKTYGLEDSVTVWADDDKLDKICFNLLSNALKFTSTGGKVEFSLDVISHDAAAALFVLSSKDTDSRYLKISVRDTGAGVPEGELENIFERYYQIEHKVAGAYSWGTGIGLYFAKTLAGLHHGYLKADHQPTGTGTIFTLILPVSESSYAETEKDYLGGADAGKEFRVRSVRYTDVPMTAHGDKLHKVLVVDDDADVIHYLKELLSSQFEVLSRFDADSAYQVIREEAVDIVISDVVMPGKTGYDLCRMIKDNIQVSHIPVILLTAKATVGEQVEGLDSGADAYVTKPFEPQYLIALIQSQLRNREKIRDMLGRATDVDTLDDDALSPQDSAFMNDLYQLMENELANSELDVSRMTEILHISRTKFYYKVKGLTGENPSVFFKRYKLNRAAQLLKERKYNVSEIADLTGFSTLSHFSTSFKKQFGVSPSEYVK